MTMSNLYKPTESELEILSILWDKGHATVREVHQIIHKTKNVGYTTTLKLMQIMFAKGLVSRNDSFKTHIYTANFDKLAAQEQYLDKLTKVLFNGSTTSLVLKALEKQTNNLQELAAIKAVIRDVENK